MPRNPWGIPIKPIKIKAMGFGFDPKKKKRKTLLKFLFKQLKMLKP